MHRCVSVNVCTTSRTENALSFIVHLKNGCYKKERDCKGVVQMFNMPKPFAEVKIKYVLIIYAIT